MTVTIHQPEFYCLSLSMFLLAPGFILLCPCPNRRGIKRCFCLHLSVAYIWRNSRTESPRKTKNGREVAHVTRELDTNFKVKRSKVALVGCTGRPTWTYSNGDLSICVHDVYYVMSPLAGLGGGISWRPPAYSLFLEVTRGTNINDD